ncbi:class I SAM-dependent methyltransferase [Streptomyces sp. NPDC056835]|uniref:class I SAM-dependent methyltransferase n=1 Tax=Streptomyces sp. NPDC056835 TaxID=3345956 RepID=UPI0036BE8733
MTRTLGRQHQWFAHPGTAPGVLADAGARARDWAEIQERMLVPLYEAVYERLEVRNGTRVLGLGCGSGLALLLAAARGARVTGVDSDSARLALARERLRADPERDGRADRAAGTGTLLPVDRMADAAPGPGRSPYDLITAFQPIGSVAGDAKGLGPALDEAIPLARHGTPVVLAGWGPPERCATDGVLRVAGRLSDRPREDDAGRPGHRDDLEEVAARAGLKPDGSGRVACPFGYADQQSAVRGLLSTGVFDGAIRTTNRRLVEKEISEALHPHLRRDGTVWMPNVFRYLIARTP